MRLHRGADVLLIITQHRVGRRRRRCSCLEVRCCGADNDSYAHAVSPSGNLCANGARAFVISNLDPDRAFWYFYGAVNAGGCNDRYFEF